MSSALMIGVSGLRGVIGTSLTPEVAARFAGVFGGWLVNAAAGQPVRVVLGRDGRVGNAVIYHAATAGLLAAGVEVVDLGISMTPTTAVMVDEMSRRPAGDGTPALVAGMELTASHNPQQWNGLKCFLATTPGLHGSAACAPPAAIAQQLVELFHAGKVGLATWAKLGSVARDESASVVHIERVVEALTASGVHDDPDSLGRGLSVVLDSVNASGIEVGREGLERLGVQELLHIGCEETGLFPHTPEPVRENLDLLCEAVRESGAAVGFAQDPDGDRLAIIDERGQYIGEEYTLLLGAMAVLEGHKRLGHETKGQKLVTNLSTSRMLDDLAARYGATVTRTPVGEANVVSLMKMTESIVGGEGNGGTIWPRVTYVRDSLSSMALVLALLENGRRPLSQIVAGLPAYAIVKRKVDLASKEAAKPSIDKLAKAYAAQRVDLQDGVRIDFDAQRAWLHVRASNTEPIMRLIAEAPTAATAQSLLDDAAKIIAG
ncbi:MAG: phosphoglucosamine mutase [Planctomycetota bacterium]